MRGIRVRPVFLAATLTWAVFGPSAEAQTLHTVTSDGHPMAVWEKRPGGEAKAAVLLLHGRTWSALQDSDLQVPGEDLSLMDGLTARGYAVYALDQRGYGATPRDETGWLPPARATTAEAAASDFIVPGSISDAAVAVYVQAALAADPVRVDWTAAHQWNALDPEGVTVPTLRSLRALVPTFWRSSTPSCPATPCADLRRTGGAGAPSRTAPYRSVPWS